MEVVSQVQNQVNQVTNQVSNLGSPLRQFPKANSQQKTAIVVLAIAMMIFGIGSGKVLAGRSGSVGNTSPTGKAVSNATQNNNEAGIADESTFKDEAEGVLEEGGIDGEGNYHLVRPGGASQYVYLSSTVIDLGSFVGKKVKVWGQTLSGRKAGWLMDVGKVRVIE